MTDIPRERKALTAQGLKIRTREQAGFTFDYSDDRAVVEPAHDFFLHVAVVKAADGTQAGEDKVARFVEEIGIGRFPHTGISYNALAFQSGRLQEGQPLTRRGAHTINDYHLTTCPTHGGSLLGPTGDAWNLNYSVRALCLPQMPDDPVTDPQLRAAGKWAAALIRAGLAAPGARWHGHKDVANKECPGRAYRLIGLLMTYTRYYMTVGLLPTTPTGGDMQFTDPVPGAAPDPDGSVVTVGEALNRGNWAYRNGPIEGSYTDQRLDNHEKRLDALEA
jgi:hypothetical protein